MATISRFEDIESWKTARLLTNMIYEFSAQEKFSRDYGLKDQMQRAAVSIMSNIAEGFESQTQPQFIRYLGLAKASAGEVRSHLYVASDQHYIDQEQFKQAFDLADKALRQLVRFIAYLEANPESRRLREDGADYSA